MELNTGLRLREPPPPLRDPLGALTLPASPLTAPAVPAIALLTLLRAASSRSSAFSRRERARSVPAFCIFKSITIGIVKVGWFYFWVRFWRDVFKPKKRR